MHDFSTVHLQRESWPEWYHLDFTGPSEGCGPALVVTFARTALERYIDDRRGELCSAEGFDSDYMSFAGVFNVEHSFDGEQHLVTYRVPVPTLEQQGESCAECNEDEWCSRCGGTGRKISMEWERLTPVMSFLSPLRPLLSAPEKKWVDDLPTRRRQLLSVVMGSRGSRGSSAYIGGTLSRELSDHLRAWSPQCIPAVESAMHQTYLALFPSYRRFGTWGLRAQAYNRGQLILDVPDKCGLCVNGMDGGLRDGVSPFDLDCYNVDSDAQVVTLLAGLAALSGEVRELLAK